MTEVENQVIKPNCVLDYIKFMCGVDHTDQLASYYTPLRKSLKWYRKILLHLLDLAMTNGFLLYKKMGGTQSQIWFRIEVIRCRVTDDSRSPIRIAGLQQTPTKKCAVCNQKGVRKE